MVMLVYQRVTMFNHQKKDFTVKPKPLVFCADFARPHGIFLWNQRCLHQRWRMKPVGLTSLW